jgi:predicted Zn-dependent protease with MMP-like domain
VDSRFPRASRRSRLRVAPEEFEELVEKALDELPEDFAELMDNVVVTVAEEPSEEDLQNLEDDDPDDPERGELFGLYLGVPRTERDSYYQAMPDRILLFSGPILRACRTRAEAIEEIKKTVLHELGHYFGMDEEDMPY